MQFASNPPTAGFTMASGALSATDGQKPLSLTVAPGGSAPVAFDGTARSQAFNGATISSWQWTIDGAASSTSGSFSTSLAKGSHPVSLVVTDSRGAQSNVARGTVSVTESAGPAVAYVTLGDTNQLAIVDVAARTVSRVGVGANPASVAVSPDHRRVYVGNSGSATVSVLDATTNAVVASIPVLTGPGSLAVTPDGGRLYVVTDPFVTAIDTAASAVIATIPLGPSLRTIAVDPSGAPRAYVTSATGLYSNVYVIDTAKNVEVLPPWQPTGGDPNPVGIAISPSGGTAYLATDSYGSLLFVVNLATGEVSSLTNLGNGGGNSGVALSPDGGKLFILNANNPPEVGVLQTSPLTILANVQVGGASPDVPTGIALGQGGAVGYVVNRVSNTLVVFSTATYAILDTIPLLGTPSAVAAP